MSASCACGASWTGLRIEHCSLCHQTFTGTTSGDRHRVGGYNPDDKDYPRRCLTAEQMTAKGMTLNKRGQWTNGGTFPADKFATDEPEPARDNHEHWASVCTCGLNEQERTGHYPEHADWCDVPSPMDDDGEQP